MAKEGWAPISISRGELGWGNMASHKFLILFIISLNFTFFACFAQSESVGKEKLDVVLIIDNSNSMGNTDPKQLRIKAAQAFVGYLRLNEDKIDARIGIVLFGTHAELTSPLTPVIQDENIRKNITAQDMTFTNFPTALEQAYLAFEGAPPDRQCVYVLFTDGRPEPFFGADANQEFPKIENWVNKFRSKSCQLFVMATGKAVIDEEKWKKFADGPRIIKGTKDRIDGYIQLEKIEGIYEQYRKILKELTGLDLGKPCGQGSGPYDVIVEPYLQKIIFAIVKLQNPEATIEIHDPDGNLLKPDPPSVLHTGGGRNWDEGFSIVKPKLGKWTIMVKGGSVSCWADRYFLKIKKLEPGIDHIAGDPLLIRAQLVDPEGKPSIADPSLPPEITANIKTRTSEGEPGNNINATPIVLIQEKDKEDTFSGKFFEKDKFEEGEYILELKAQVTLPSQITPIDVQRFTLKVSRTPFIVSVQPEDVEIKKTAPVKVVVGLTRIAPDLDVLAGWRSNKGVEPDRLIECAKKAGTNEFLCNLGRPLPTGQVLPLEDSGPYSATIFLKGQTPSGLSFDGERDPRFRDDKSRFCVTEPRDVLPWPDKDKIKVTKDQEGKHAPEQDKGAFIRVPIKSLEKTTPGKLTVTAIVTDPDGKKIQLVDLHWVNESIYEGELQPLSKFGAYNAQVIVAGTTPDGCPISAAQLQQPYNFSVPDNRSILQRIIENVSRHWPYWIAALVLSIVVIWVIWKLLFGPLVTPSVDGKLIITDPLGKELPPVDLYGQGAHISIGSEGDVRLDATLDSNVAGKVAELRAKVVDRRRVVRNLGYRTGDNFEESQEIYHGDEFSVGRFRFRYENLAAERETVSDILDTE